jgi:hypothetical protein
MSELGQKPHLRKVRFWRKADIRETPTSVKCQTEKNSVRAIVFRFAPESGPYSMQTALRILCQSATLHAWFEMKEAANEPTYLAITKLWVLRHFLHS